MLFYPILLDHYERHICCVFQTFKTINTVFLNLDLSEFFLCNLFLPNRIIYNISINSLYEIKKMIDYCNRICYKYFMYVIRTIKIDGNQTYIFLIIRVMPRKPSYCRELIQNIINPIFSTHICNRPIHKLLIFLCWIQIYSKPFLFFIKFLETFN